MKRGTPRHPKTKVLARLLKIPVPHAIGILELMWHFASEFTPEGDIGRMTDEDIADAVMWKKDIPALIDSLVTAKWLDRSADHRLLVHDWHDHADEATRKKLIRAGSDFATDGTARKRNAAVIYFIQAEETKRIKIGFTKGDPNVRMMDLQVGCTERLSLLASVSPGTKDYEVELHRKFSHASVTGEWFNPSQDLLAFIEGLSVGSRPISADNVGQKLPRGGLGKEGQGKADLDLKDKPPDDFSHFLVAVKYAELPHSDMDIGLARAEWTRLSFEQKLAATAGLIARKDAGDYDDPKYRPLPQNYISEHKWQRPIRGRARDPATDKLHVKRNEVLQLTKVFGAMREGAQK